MNKKTRKQIIDFFLLNLAYTTVLHLIELIYLFRSKRALTSVQLRSRIEH